MERKYFVQFFRFSEDGKCLELWRSQYFAEKLDAIAIISKFIDFYDRIDISNVKDQ